MTLIKELMSPGALPTVSDRRQVSHVISAFPLEEINDEKERGPHIQCDRVIKSATNGRSTSVLLTVKNVTPRGRTVVTPLARCRMRPGPGGLKLCQILCLNTR